MQGGCTPSHGSCPAGVSGFGGPWAQGLTPPADKALARPGAAGVGGQAGGGHGMASSLPGETQCCSSSAGIDVCDGAVEGCFTWGVFP